MILKQKNVRNYKIITDHLPSSAIRSLIVVYTDFGKLVRSNTDPPVDWTGTSFPEVVRRERECNEGEETRFITCCKRLACQLTYKKKVVMTTR